ncbi:MAG: hypothetical protein HQL50_01095 [Magnetococcales bacterium]|nr:hypothetical protein [Magnetococcales bacterium]
MTFTHLMPKKDRLLFVSPHRTGLNAEEMVEIIEALREEFATEGWSILPLDATRCLIALPIGKTGSNSPPFRVGTIPPERMEGRSIRPWMPVGPDASTLHQLMTIGQLLLARHPLNTTRTLSGRLPLNSPWIWGISASPFPLAETKEGNKAPDSRNGSLWSSSPVVRGAGALAGFATQALSSEFPSANQDETRNLLNTLSSRIEHNPKEIHLLHLQTPAHLARHGLHNERLEIVSLLDSTVIAPLAEMLHKHSQPLVITDGLPLNKDGTTRTEPLLWVAAQGKELLPKRRFWPVGNSLPKEQMSLRDFVSRWLTGE